VPLEATLNRSPAKTAVHTLPWKVFRWWIAETLPASFVLVMLAGQGVMAQPAGSIRGSVLDSSGAPILGAVVTAEGANGNRSVTATDAEGTFKISPLTPGSYRLRISAAGLSDFTDPAVNVAETAESTPLAIVLQVAPQVTTVTVGLSPQEVAADQLNQELKQRVLGLIPNYYVAYENNAAHCRRHRNWISG
jgi:hypothetical protein